MIELEYSKDMQPLYATQDAAGADLMAREAVTLPAYCTTPLRIPTGVWIKDVEMPANGKTPYLALHVRSGLASKGIVLANGVGIIDHNYRNEIQVLLWNLTGNEVVIQEGMRIAQLVYCETETIKGAIRTGVTRTGGFGSTN